MQAFCQVDYYKLHGQYVVVLELDERINHI